MEKKKNPELKTSYEIGTLDLPINVLLKDHEIANEDLNLIRRITNNFTPPKNACNSFSYLYDKLKEFETDLNEHFRLEKDYLFPKALELDRELAGA